MIRFISIAILFFFTLSGAGATTSGTDLAARLKVAFQQGVLAQSMAKSACFAMTGISTRQNTMNARDDWDSFSTGLVALKDGHEWLGLAPESNPSLRASVDDLAGVWGNFGPAVQQILHEDYHSVVLGQILYNGDPVVDASIEVARDIAQQYGTGILPPEMVEALALAAYHRMLSQRAIKEMCFVLAEIGGDTMSYRLEFTLQEYADVLARLRSGDNNVAAPPNARIERSFRTADLFWSKMIPVFEKVIAGERPEDADIAKLLKFNTSVMKQLVAASDAYMLDL